MIARATQYYYKSIQPGFFGWLTRLLYSSRNVSIGKRFKADGLPRILIDKTAMLEIGDDVYFRRNVEIRVHQQGSVQLGNNIRIDRSIRILASNQSKINIGDKSRIGLNSILNGGDSITIGTNVLISGYVYLQTSMHNFSGKEAINAQGYAHKPIEIEDDVWIGTHVTIMPGIVLREGSVVGSSAVVTKSHDHANIVLGGIPAKPIKNRFE